MGGPPPRRMVFANYQRRRAAVPTSLLPVRIVGRRLRSGCRIVWVGGAWRWSQRKIGCLAMLIAPPSVLSTRTRPSSGLARRTTTLRVYPERAERVRNRWRRNRTNDEGDGVSALEHACGVAVVAGPLPGRAADEDSQRPLRGRDNRVLESAHRRRRERYDGETRRWLARVPEEETPTGAATRDLS